MIIKPYGIDKVNLDKNSLILLYGNNEGLKKEIIKKLTKDQKKIFNYDEKIILETKNIFFENLFNKSLFEEKKTIVIKRTTDKILEIVKQIYLSKIEDKIILISDNLEKKSKLRSFFEKEKELICFPVYPDDSTTLFKLINNFVKERKIIISKSNINQILFKSVGDREKLFNELEKIDNFVKNGKKLTDENVAKLINLSENYSVNELIDSCLAKNKIKTIKILSENNYTSEDSIIILRTLINKSKKILKLATEYKINNNIDLTISNAKPPIFWKDKDIIKQQILKWNPLSLKLLIYKSNEIEFRIKKNINNSLYLVNDLLFDQLTTN